MRFPVSVPGMEGQSVEVVTPGLSGSVKVIVNGVPAQAGSQRGAFLVQRPDGQVSVIQLKPGSVLDGAVRITVDGTPQILGTPRKPFEIVLIWMPAVLMFAGGAIGGVFAGIAISINLALFQSKKPNGVKYGGAILMAAGAFALYFAVALALYRRAHPDAAPQLPNTQNASRVPGVGPEDLALADKGATATSDSELASEPGCTPRVIDGILANSNDFSNRWHSSITTPHPHWVQVTLPRPAKVGRVNIHFADPQGYAVSFAGIAISGGQRRVLFDVKNYKGKQTYTATLAPTMLNAFRLVIRKSANPDYSNAAQVSEIALYPPANGSSED